MTSEFYKKQRQKWGDWWRGNFGSWEEAEKECIGYDQEHIVKKVYQSILATRYRTDCYERDSCIINGFPEYTLNFIEYLNNKNIIDFGGGLGSTYFAIKHVAQAKKWNVVEQDLFVKYGKQLEDDCLSFFSNINDIDNVDVILFSSSLPYIKNAYDFVDIAIKKQIQCIIFDRHSVILNGKQDLLTIQIVPEDIYPTIYPCWFFGENKLKQYMENNNYKLQKEFMSLGDTSCTGGYVNNSAYKGYIYEK